MTDTEDNEEEDLGVMEDQRSVILHLISQLKLGMDLTRVWTLSLFIIFVCVCVCVFSHIGKVVYLFIRVWFQRAMDSSCLLGRISHEVATADSNKNNQTKRFRNFSFFFLFSFYFFQVFQINHVLYMYPMCTLSQGAPSV